MTSSPPASKPVVTRFAPSPTGFLHIGGARTALFNWLFARHHNGTFLLRIEDTDRARSSQAATDAILEGLTWLGLDWDAEPISQFERADRHAEVARQMVADGTAYRCYATREEIEAARATAKEAGLPPTFHSPWRDASAPADPDAPHVIRLRAPLTGQTTVIDLVQGPVTWENSTLDDLILLRSDGTPTYMLAVVVDDHDMSISHVIRGDDHLTNAARQTLIYQAAGWDLPEFAHIPLIHGPDGAKLSKRHGALGVEAYRDMGYPARAVCNYLARLGWSHGDDEFFTIEQAVQWFSLEQVGKSPARFDFKKLDNLSGQHIRAMTDAEIAEAVTSFVATQHDTLVTPERQAQLLKAAPSLKERAKKIPELAEMAHFILADRPFLPDEKAAEQLDTVSQGMLGRLTTRLQHVSWTQPELDAEIRTFAEEEGLKLGKVAQPLRAALTGRTVSPSVFDVMEIIGKTETLDRLRDATG